MKKIFVILSILFSLTNAYAGLEEIFGHAENGDRCLSDYQCQSLCCNSSEGICSPHNPAGNSPIFCSKSPGESCVISEFCVTEAVTVCRLIKVSTKPDGSQNCTLRCGLVETHGSCINNTCVSPRTPPIPPYNPENPDCSSAI